MRGMKNSGVGWLGCVPSGWNILRIANLYCERNESGSDDLPILSVSINSGISDHEIEDEEQTRKFVRSEDRSMYKKVYPGDLAYNMMRAWQGAFGAVRTDGMISPAYVVARPKEGVEVDSRYMEALLRTPSAIKEMHRYSRGITDFRLRLYWPEFKNIQVCVPPIEEQKEIADFLDKEITNIDDAIDQTRASIEEYKKLKQAVITQAVTKGIRPDRQMKDSGIEWMGTIPASWSIAALKHLCSMQSGKNITSEQISESGDYPVFGGNGQRGFFTDYNCEGKRLLVGRQGALCGNVHRVGGKFWATEHAVITDSTSICNMDYLYYLLVGMNLNQYVSSTAAQPGLAVSTIQNVRTCIPPLAEQMEIADYLDLKCLKIDALIEQKKYIVAELESYKKSLIYDYVTGKKEVAV